MSPKRKRQAPKALHSSISAEHFTPEAWVERIRATMGTIDLDPASCAEANRVVKAAGWFGKNDRSLVVPWVGNVLINSPSTCELEVCGNPKVCSCQLVQRFWEKLVREYLEGRVEQAVWVGFTLNQLQTLQRTEVGGPISAVPAGHRSISVPNTRIRYSGDSPPHPSFFVYLGRNKAAFAEHFGPHGEVIL